MSNFNKKTRKFCILALVITLILGVLSSSFGITVMAITKTQEAKDTAKVENNDKNNDKNNTVESPLEKYKDFADKAILNKNINVLSKDVASRVKAIKIADEITTIIIEGKEEIKKGDIIYIEGEKDTPIEEDKIYKVEDVIPNEEKNETEIKVTEPKLEEVFNNIEISATDKLTESNLIKAEYAKGVTSYYGDGKVALNKAEGNSNSKDDLIFDIDYAYDLNRSENGDNATFEISGNFALCDLTANFVLDMEDLLTINDFFVGMSGDVIADLNLTSNFDSSAYLETIKPGDTTKRFPLAVLTFEGNSEIKLDSKLLENGSKALKPTYVVTVYADWEGNISMKMSSKVQFADSFNSGFKVYDNKKAPLAYENYNDSNYFDVESDTSWETSIMADADKDITLFGNSVTFSLAGVELSELSIARIGAQIYDEVSIKTDSEGKTDSFDADSSYAYIKLYIDLLETKLGIAKENHTCLKDIDENDDYNFCMFDYALFENGRKPDRFKDNTIVATSKAPVDFDTATTLVFDLSTSMDESANNGQTKLEAAKEASKTIVKTTKNWSQKYNTNDGIGVVYFSDNSDILAPQHTDYNYINNVIDAMDTIGGTNIYTGIDSAITQLDAINCMSKSVILLTDGKDGSRSQTLESARTAADKGIKIFTIGFGNSTNAVDESLLMEIAEITGGEYRFASTDDMLGITSSFMYAQQSSAAEVITDINGAVKEGETSEETTFNVDPKNGDLIVSTLWPGSFLDTILVDPNGRVVDENYPGAVTDETQIPSTITVQNPIEGEWKVSVLGVETSYEEEPFYTIVSFKETEGNVLNGEMTILQLIASYCIPIGLFATIASIILLCCFKKKKTA